MSQIQKVYQGQKITDDDFVEFLKAAHSKAPGMTPAAFESPRTSEGKSPYQVLAETALNSSGSVRNILDLACGDGHLISYYDKLSKTPLEITGVDMSEDELALAKKKTYQNKVRFKCEMAQQVSEPNQSFDVISCHMAFMLMEPALPVANEIFRLLKPKGLFAAVISANQPDTQGFAGVFRQVFTQFMKEKYPLFARHNSDDPPLDNVEGLRQIFPETKFSSVKVQDILLSQLCTPAEIWNYYRDFYYVAALPENDYEELKSRTIQAAQNAANSNGFVDLKITLKLITCVKV